MKDPHRPRESDKSALGGLSIAALGSLLAILGADALTMPLKIAIISFSFSLPILSSYFFMAIFGILYGMEEHPDYMGCIPGSAMLVCLIGIGAMFFHVWWIGGIVFVASALFAYGAMGYHMDIKLRRGHRRRNYDDDTPNT